MEDALPGAFGAPGGWPGVRLRWRFPATASARSRSGDGRSSCPISLRSRRARWPSSGAGVSSSCWSARSRVSASFIGRRSYGAIYRDLRAACKHSLDSERSRGSMDHHRDGQIDARFACRLSRPGPTARLHRDRGLDDRARRRRELGDLQRRRRGHAPAAALPRPGRRRRHHGTHAAVSDAVAVADELHRPVCRAASHSRHAARSATRRRT